MQLSIHSRGIVLSDNVKRFAYDKIVMALGRLERQVRKISLYLVDVNGPDRGGEDKLCRVVVRIHNQGVLVVEDRDSNIGVAIDRLSDRLSMAAERRMERLRARRGATHRRRTHFDA